MTEDINVPLLRKAVEWVEEQDELRERTGISAWMQDTWVSAREMVAPSSYRLRYTRSVREGVVDHIEVQQLDDDWCGTACCLAGYVATIAAPEEGKEVRFFSGSPYVVDKSLPVDADLLSADNYISGKVEHVPAFADRVLGLPYSHMLYDGGNSAEKIRALAEEMTGEKL